MRRAGAVAASVAVASVAVGLALVPGPASASPSSGAASPSACLTLPTVVVPTLPAGNAVGATPERLATSKVPGPVANIEHVRVAVDPSGTPATVAVEQTLQLSGAGDYVVYERGPARSVEPLAETAPPTLKLGRVTWAGYVPRAETLAARLGLDPTIEATRLPLTLAVAGGRVTLSNATALPDAVLDVAPVPASELAGPLDLLLGQARSRERRPAVAGAGLPATLGCDGGRPTGSVLATTVAPLRVTGTLGPGTAGAGATAGRLDGVLASVPATFAVTSFAPDLTVAPGLDPRTLTPPTGYATWAAWAASRPDAAARTAASETLMAAAAASARVREIEPYLAADLPGTADTDFSYAPVRAAAPVAAVRPLRPRRVPIALAVLGVLVVVGGAGALARRL